MCIRDSFIDFEGSSTGTMVFEKFAGPVAKATDVVGALNDVAVFPNPVTTEAEITFSLDKSEDMTVMITSMLGQNVYRENRRGQAGFNAITLSDLQLSQGNYVLTLMSASGKGISKKLTIVE